MALCKLMLLAACSLNMLALGSARSSGAPEEACENLTPQHGGSVGLTTLAPYSFTISKNLIKTNEEITLTLKGHNAIDTFEGFFVQARHDGTKAIGQFIVSPQDPLLRTVDCFDSKNNSLTHKDKMPKEVITFTWKAPDTIPANGTEVVFMYTIVKSYNQFWVRLQSPVVKVFNAAVQMMPVSHLAIAGCMWATFSLWSHRF